MCLSGELAFLHGRCGVKPSVCVLGCDMGPGREEKLLRRHSLKRVPRHHLELAWRWPCFPSPRPMSAPGIGKETIRVGFWETWKGLFFFFLQAPKQLHRHVYIDAKKLPEGRRKNNLTDRELRPHDDWS